MYEILVLIEVIIVGIYILGICIDRNLVLDIFNI